jgi:hypothetical protein
MAKWWGEGLEEQYGDRLNQFDRYRMMSSICGCMNL